MKKDLLVTLADGNFIDQAKQLFSSVYWNAGWQGDYMLLAHDIPEEELKWFQEKGILVTRCESLSTEKAVGGRYPSTVLSKLHLFTPAFKTWGRVVFLDGDIIVRGPLGYLQTISGFGARYYHLPLLDHFASLEGNKTLFKRLRKDFDLKQDSFNSGVISFQTDIITEDMFRELMVYTSHYIDYSTYADEGILNLFFSERCTALPHSFNSMVQHEPESTEEGATILHFNSESFRPWQKTNPFYEEWSANLRRAEDIDLSQTLPPREASEPEDCATVRESLEEKVNRYKRYFSLFLRIRHPFVHAILRKIKAHLKPLAALRLLYYRCFLRAILFSDTIVCDPRAGLDLHMVVCKKDVLNCLWAVKTFHFYSGMTFNLVIHEDGSFTNRQVKLLERHFENCEVIRREEADSQMKHFLKEYPYISKFRAAESFYCALKLVDPLYYGNAEKIVTFDTDILFFRKPDEMIGLLGDEKPFFSSDYMNSYRYPVEVLNDLFGVDIYPRVNAGFLFFGRKVYLENLSVMEAYFREVDKQEEPFSWINRHEQTLHALLMTRLGAERLGRDYSISWQPIGDKTAYHHFVSDSSRNTYYTEGLKVLKAKKFLKAFNEQAGTGRG